MHGQRHAHFFEQVSAIIQDAPMMKFWEELALAILVPVRGNLDPHNITAALRCIDKVRHWGETNSVFKNVLHQIEYLLNLNVPAFNERVFASLTAANL